MVLVNTLFRSGFEWFHSRRDADLHPEVLQWALRGFGKEGYLRWASGVITP
jgi:hypothetical protein